jgi:hypothetical protein
MAADHLQPSIAAKKGTGLVDMLRCALLAMLVASCVDSAAVSPAAGPDGSPNWYKLACNNSRIDCYVKAGELCRRGYDLAKVEKQSGSDYSNAGTTLSKRAALGGGLLIRCH